MTPILFAVEQVREAPGPLVHVHPGPDGVAVGATAATLVRAPAARVWAILEDVEHYAQRVPMIHRVRVHGTRATVSLKFRMSLVSVGFEFVVDAVREENSSFELRYVSGEPRGIQIRFDVAEQSGGHAPSTLLHATIGFDVFSLGWLVKLFLRHHPEIQFGIFPGCALALLASMRQGAEG